MIIENSFEVAIAPERALDVLTDVPSIAPCIPGVTLTGSDGDLHHGTAAVRLGPVSLTFAGEARIVEIDREARSARVEAEGADQKGRGRARATVDFALAPAGEGTRVDVRSDVTLSGQVAQYGRASGLIREVANQIIGEFARNLEAKLSAGQAGDADPGAPDRAAPAGTGKSAGRERGRETGRKQEISGFGLLLRSIGAMIARLFSR